MIRLALVVNRLTVGGLERVVLELARRLDRGAFAPHLICLESAGALAREVEAAGVPVTVLGARVGLAPAALASAAHAWPRALAWMARVRPHVVQTHLFFAQVLGGAAARALGVPVVHVEQNFYAWKGALARAGELAALGPRGVVVTPTAVLARHHRARLGLPGRRVRVIANGVEAPARTDARRAQARRQLGAGPRDVVVGLAERLVAGKRQDVLLDAARRAVRRDPSLKFALIGDGPMRGELARRACEGPLAGRVRLVGEVTDAGPWLEGLDIYATASTMEGFGIAPVEALARGVPVVAPAVPVFQETLGATGAAWLCAPGSSEDLARRLVALARHRERRGEMGDAGVRAARATYAIDGMTRAYQELYRELARRR